jgi:hypothetical protein
MMITLDELLDLALAEAEIENGVLLEMVARRYPGRNVAPELVCTSAMYPPRWSEAEIEFVRNRLGRQPLEVIGAELGRSANAVKIIQIRHGLPAPSKRPGWLTGNQVAMLLGVDTHAVCLWTDTGLLSYQLVPGQGRIRSIRYMTLLRWAINPLNWIYFKHSVDSPERILDPKLRRLIVRQKARWGDEWWTPSQVAAYHGVDHTDVNRLIHQGKIRGVKYGNWWILRSEAMRPGLRFFKDKGNTWAQMGDDWSEEAEAFVIRARARGMMFKVIARMMKMPEKKIKHHYYQLKQRGQIEVLAQKFGLEVHGVQ